jgi:aminopeptidase N
VQDDLAWFWDPWFFQRGHPDLGIEEVSADAVTIEKIGLLPVPVQVTLRFDDESEEVISKPMSIWKEGDRQFTFPLSSDKKLLQISLGSPHIPDVDTTNNEYTVP